MIADDDADEGSMIDSTIFVIVKSLFAGRKFLMPPIRESRFAPRFVGTPVSFIRSVKRVEMDEKRPKRSDDAADVLAWLEFTVASCVILVVERTLRGN